MYFYLILHRILWWYHIIKHVLRVTVSFKQANCLVAPSSVKFWQPILLCGAVNDFKFASYQLNKTELVDAGKEEQVIISPILV